MNNPATLGAVIVLIFIFLPVLWPIIVAGVILMLVLIALCAIGGRRA